MNKKGFVEIILPLAIVFAALSIAFGYRYWFKAPDDNPVEEIAEEVIKKETGVLIDLTPNSPEK